MRIATFCGIWMLSFVIVKAQHPSKLSFFHQQMGTQFKVIIYSDDKALATKAAKAAFAKIDTLNAIFSDYQPDSELNELANYAGNQPQKISPEMGFLLKEAAGISKKTKGAFDITIGPLSRLWRRAFRRQEFPLTERIETARQKVGYKNLKLSANQKEVQFLVEGMRLDAGGIAKGYAVDKAVEVLHSFGLQQILVDGGGDIYAGLAPDGEKGWRVLIQEVQKGKIEEAVLWLNQQAIATSGDTYHFLEWEGKRYSHIIDPRTGIGNSDQLRVSVRAPNCTIADALASAITVSGAQKGLKLIKKFKGTKARIIIQEKNQAKQIGF